MGTAGAFFIKIIDKGQAFVVRKAQPFSVEQGAEVVIRAEVVVYVDDNAAGFGKISAIGKAGADNGGRGIVYQLKTAQLAEAGGRPFFLPFYFGHLLMAAGKALHHDAATLFIGQYYNR